MAILDSIRDLVTGSRDLEDLSKKLDEKIADGTLPTNQDAVTILREQAKSYAQPQSTKRSRSKLDVRRQQDILVPASQLFYNALKEIAAESDNVPPYGNPQRDDYLSKVWQKEPILAGAVYSMAAKMTALTWKVVGRRRLAQQAAQMFSAAAYIDGYDWGGFISSSATDFFTTDDGVFWETVKSGNPLLGRLVEIGHIDSIACTLTGHVKYPVIYNSALTGQENKFRPGEIVHFASMPSPREEHLGKGFCAVSRAIRAAKLLMGLHEYDEEKLSNLPPEGVAAVTGLTMREFQDAVKLWRTKREQNISLTFPQVLWLIGSNPGASVKLDFIGFSQMPESFDRKTVVPQYVNTLALAFGVDTREFWPVSTSTLGTAAESEIQHEKAKGKGPGEFLTITERALNNELPEGVDFEYDTQDIEEDKNAAEIAKGWVDAYIPMMAPAVEGVEPLLKREDVLRLLADKGVIPDYMAMGEREVIESTEVHVKSLGYSEDFTSFEWSRNGGIIEKRLPPIVLYGRVQQAISDGTMDPIPAEREKEDEIVEAEFIEIKQGESKIRGQPIPEKEVVRGDAITENTLKAEMKLWRSDKRLEPFVPTEDEEEDYIQRTLDEGSNS